MKFTKPKKIFIVDDDPMFQEALKDYLTREVAHEITCFPTGEDCLQELAAKPDVIVLDYNLNSVKRDAANGSEILDAILKYGSNTRVIMLSSQDQYAVAVRAIKRGAEEYVIKDDDSFEKINTMVSEMR